LSLSDSGIIQPPFLAGGLPWLGYAININRDPVRFLMRGRERFGEQWSFLLAGKVVTFFSGPRANEAFFRAPEDQFSAREAYQFTVPIFGNGIAYDTTPEIMSEQLGFVFPALRDERMQRYGQFMAEEAESYVRSWRAEGEVDMYTMCNELTTFIASRCLLGHEFRSNLTKETARLYHDLEGGINLVAFVKPDFPLPAHFRRDRARRRMVELISGIIASRRRTGAVGEDFLQTLMTARYKDGSGLDDDGITGMLLTLLFAGQHTSAVAASWTGILMLQHPRVLPAILAEQDAIFGGRESGEMTLEAFRQMSALDRAVMEAERMYPPLIMLMRAILRDFEYNGRVSKAGGLAMVAPSVSHRLPEVWKDPDRYDPDRFGPGREEHKQANYTLIGFGGGKHRCIGMAFAYQQVKAIWSVLLRRYEFELCEKKYEPNYATFVVGPRQPCRVRYRRRKRAAISAPRPAVETA
jgi:sterol 14alpha-demethylase